MPREAILESLYESLLTSELAPEPRDRVGDFLDKVFGWVYTPTKEKIGRVLKRYGLNKIFTPKDIYEIFENADPNLAYNLLKGELRNYVARLRDYVNNVVNFLEPVIRVNIGRNLQPDDFLTENEIYQKFATFYPIDISNDDSLKAITNELYQIYENRLTVKRVLKKMWNLIPSVRRREEREGRNILKRVWDAIPKMEAIR